MNTVVTEAEGEIANRAHAGRGLLICLVLLLFAEGLLHVDATMYRLRSVFAVGRAMDKVRHVEQETPEFLILGNSRADNAFDPRAISAAASPPHPISMFNLALPGADIGVVHGIMRRLDERRMLGPGRVRFVALCLDEALLQPIDTLGQDVFFDDRAALWHARDFLGVIKTLVRLYGYSDNLKQLREPATLVRFVQAISHDSDPVGGRAERNLGFRAGTGDLQGNAAATRQEAGSRLPPTAASVALLWETLDLLRARDVRVVIVFPPLLARDVLYLDTTPDAAPFRDVLTELRRRELPVIRFTEPLPRNPAEFINAGHLNARGAARYSAALGNALHAILAADSDR